jgi:hypothetical protein
MARALLPSQLTPRISRAARVDGGMIALDAAPVLAVGEPPAIASDPGRGCRALPGPLARRIEAGMSILSPPERPSAGLVAGPAGATPWFTRHMPGAIEAERDRRGAARATRPRAARGRTATPHPRIAAARAAQARRLTQARLDYSRWVNEGGSFDPEGAARLGLGDRAMRSSATNHSHSA